jgi:hypothetical protein
LEIFLTSSMPAFLAARHLADALNYFAHHTTNAVVMEMIFKITTVQKHACSHRDPDKREIASYFPLRRCQASCHGNQINIG